MSHLTHTYNQQLYEVHPPPQVLMHAHRRRNHGGNGGTRPRSLAATGALPPFKTDVIILILCTKFYHLGEGAHFAKLLYKLLYGPQYIAPILEIIFLRL